MNDCIKQFEVFANELLEAAEDKSVFVFQQLHTLSTSITSHAMDANEQWPFVSLPHFDQRTQELGDLAGSDLMLFAPMVDLGSTANWTKWLKNNREIIFRDTVCVQSSICWSKDNQS